MSDDVGLIAVDFSEAKEFDDSPIPNGKYNARITEVTRKTSKKGDPYLSWKLVIFGAEGELAKQNNRVAFHTTMLSGPGSGGLKTLLKVLDVDASAGQFSPQELIGRELEVTLATRRNPDGELSAWSEVKGIKALKH